MKWLNKKRGKVTEHGEPLQVHNTFLGRIERCTFMPQRTQGKESTTLTQELGILGSLYVSLCIILFVLYK